MSRRYRRAPQPSAEVLEAREEAKALERLQAKATPVSRPPKVEHKCAGQLYQVASGKVVHGKRKGETVSLCPHKGATQALVQSGHLVLSQSASARAVTTSSSVKAADDAKEADNG